jgi:hypothetical protein
MGRYGKGRRDGRMPVSSLGSSEPVEPLPSTLRVVVGLARAVRSHAADPALTQLLGDDIDWIEVIELTDRCRMLPLLISGLRLQDPGLLDTAHLAALDDFMTGHGGRCELLIQAHARSLAALARKGVPAVTYKGPALAQTVYGDYRARDFRDLDIIVPKDDFESAIAEYEKLGYRIDDRMEAECHLISQVGEYPLVVDLHNSLTDIYLPVSSDIEGLWQDLRAIDLKGHPITTFSPEGHLLVCCLHLVKEWHNRAPFFHYALDVAMLLDERSPNDWRALLDRARALGMEDYAKLSFSVAARLLDRDCPVTWQSGEDDALQALCARLLADLPQATAMRRPSKPKFYAATSLALRRALAPSVGTWLARELRLIKNQLFFIDNRDTDWLSLPAGLRGFYYVLRPIRLTSRYLKRCLSIGR